jgi:NCS1 family nucleobase:cation symporter-1
MVKIAIQGIMDLTGSMGAIVIIVLALGIAATNSMMLYCG